MTDEIRRVDYFYAVVNDQPGEAFRILGRLKEAGVNLLSLTAFPVGNGKAQIDFVPEDAATFARAAKSGGINLSPKKQAFYVQGDDRPGAAAEIFRKLADAKVNVHAANAICGAMGGYGLILWVKPQNYKAAAKALGV